MTEADIDTPVIKTFGDLDPFLDLAERRLYRLLVAYGDRKIARVEQGDVMVPSEEAMSAFRLLTAARELRAGRP